MGRRARERAALAALARKVWGDAFYEQHVRQRARRRQRADAMAVIAIGSSLLLSAFGLMLFSTAASAHSSTINISCTRVEFVYRDFPEVTATSHESVVVDGIEVAQRDVTFEGPSAVDVIAISIGPGTHVVQASDEWVFNDSPQGSADEHQELSDCASTSTTTIPKTSTTTPSSTSVTSTTTLPKTSTSASVTTAPKSTSTSTTTISKSTTSVPTPTTVREQGSTSTTAAASTTSTIREREFPSTTTTTMAPSTALPFTGSGRLSLGAALAALGVGALTVGLARLGRTTRRP
jgi:hypothetical protein